MTDNRRYDEEEISRIFDAAAKAEAPARRALEGSSGLTLSELQEIGGSVGLPPERIAEAAAELDLQSPAQRQRTLLGSPLAVGRTVALPRPPTDREWELLVADLRETFHATGTVRSHGDTRQWSNGNLHAFIEPTEDGYRLRMGSLKGDAVPIARIGAFLLLLSVVLFMILMVGEDAESATGALLFAAMGAGALGYDAVRLRSWGSERQEQMEFIAARATALIAPASADLPGPVGPTRDGGAADRG